MHDSIRVKIGAGVDIVVAILLFIAGIFITILGLDYLDFMSLYTGYPGANPFSFFETLPWIIFMLGLATIIYGIKRLIDDILKMITTIS